MWPEGRLVSGEMNNRGYQESRRQSMTFPNLFPNLWSSEYQWGLRKGPGGLGFRHRSIPHGREFNSNWPTFLAWSSQSKRGIEELLEEMPEETWRKTLHKTLKKTMW